METKNVLWYLQKLDDVAGSKDPMSNGELVWLRRRKIRSQNTLVNATPAKDFAGSTRANNRRRRGGSGS